MTQALLASLTAHDRTGDVVDNLGPYGNGVIGWTSFDERDGRYCLEVTDEDDNTAQLWLTRDEMLRLHERLTVTLLRDAK